MLSLNLGYPPIRAQLRDSAGRLRVWEAPYPPLPFAAIPTLDEPLRLGALGDTPRRPRFGLATYSLVRVVNGVAYYE